MTTSHARVLTSSRAERMNDNVPTIPSAMRVQTKKNPPLDLALMLTPAPCVWRKGMAIAKSETRSMMTRPERRSASSSIPASNWPAATDA